jgi:hypothetical protein
MNKLSADEVVCEVAAVAGSWASAIVGDCMADDLVELRTSIENYIGRAVAVNRAAEELVSNTRLYHAQKRAKAKDRAALVVAQQTKHPAS